MNEKTIEQLSLEFYELLVQKEECERIIQLNLQKMQEIHNEITRLKQTQPNKVC